MIPLIKATVTPPITKKSIKCLLVIDIQENLLKATSKIHIDMEKRASFLDAVNKSISLFEKKGLTVLYTFNEWTNPILNLITGNACKKGAKGTNIDSAVQISGNNIFHKSENSALSNKALGLYLKTESIEELYITGLFAEFCVKSTVKNALLEQYRVVVIEEAVGSKNEHIKSNSLDYCKKKGAIVISVDSVADDLHRQMTSR